MRFNPNLKTLQITGFLAALTLYAGFGSPTPDALGWVEMTIGILLFTTIGISGLTGITQFTNKPFWFGAGQLLFIYGLITGALNGLLYGQDITAILRDLIPFTFLFLPLLLWPFIQNHPKIILAGILIIGIGFSLRVALGLDAQALYYLGNSPCVLFAALCGIGWGFSQLSQGITSRNILLSIGFFAIAALAIIPLALSLQRASLGAVAIYSILTIGIVFLHTPRRVLFILALAIPAILSISGIFEPLLEALKSKTSNVGINMRIEEWQAVWYKISTNPLRLLFGNGWGASLQSPAVADIRVNFTHSLLSAHLLKIGILGALGTVFYLYTLGRAVLVKFPHAPLIALALAAPILIDVLLYAAYKSLDFGLILTMCIAYGNIAFRRAL